MMGQGSGGQKKLFYSFNLDDHVPGDHLLRGIDRCLDLGELRPCCPRIQASGYAVTPPFDSSGSALLPSAYDS